MSFEFVWFMRIMQIVTIVILGGFGVYLLLNPIKERTDEVWEDDGMHYGMYCTRYTRYESKFGWKARVFGACCIIAMFVVLFLTEHTVVKHINLNAWELLTRDEKIEILHKNIQSLRNSIKEQDQ